VRSISAPLVGPFQRPNRKRWLEFHLRPLLISARQYHARGGRSCGFLYGYELGKTCGGVVLNNFHSAPLLLGETDAILKTMSVP